MTTKTYCILNKDYLTQDMIDEAVTDGRKIRYSSDGKAVLEFECMFPLSMFGFPKYTHEEVLVEMAKEEWLDE